MANEDNNVKFGIEVNLEGTEQAVAELDKVEDAVDNLGTAKPARTADELGQIAQAAQQALVPLTELRDLVQSIANTDLGGLKGALGSSAAGITQAPVNNEAQVTKNVIEGPRVSEETSEVTALTSAITALNASESELNKQQKAVVDTSEEAAENLNIVAENGEEAADSLEKIAEASELADGQMTSMDVMALLSAIDGVSGIAGTVASSLSSFSSSIVGLGQRAIDTAKDFESLKATLTAVQGSSEKATETFEFAKQLAATTPFDVKGVVEAAVQLEAYGASAKRVLPAVANLASAMGKPIAEVANAIGKAMSGSLEGFESLRSTYGISAALLKKYGAELNEAGAVALDNAEKLQKAKDAIINAVSARFGDATGERSKTFEGLTSNVNDTIDELYATVGQDLLPIASQVVTAFSGVLEILKDTPAPVRTVIEVVAGLSAASAGLTGVLVPAGLSLAKFAAGWPLMTAGWTSALVDIGSALTKGNWVKTKAVLSGIWDASQKAVEGFEKLKYVMGAQTVTAGALCVAAYAINSAIEQWRQEEIAKGKELEHQSAILVNVSQAAHAYADALKEVVATQSGVNAANKLDVFGMTANNLKKLVSDVGALNVASRLASKGIDTEQMKEAAAKAQELIKQRQEAVKIALEEERDATLGLSAPNMDWANSGAEEARRQKRLADSKEALSLARKQLESAQQEQLVIEQINEQGVTELENLRKMSAEVANIQSLLAVIKDSGDIKLTITAQETVKEKLAEMRKELATPLQVKESDLQDTSTVYTALQKQFKSHEPNQDLIKALQSYISLAKQNSELIKQIHDQREAGALEQVKDGENALALLQSATERRYDDELKLLERNRQAKRAYLQEQIAGASALIKDSAVPGAIKSQASHELAELKRQASMLEIEFNKQAQQITDDKTAQLVEAANNALDQNVISLVTSADKLVSAGNTCHQQIASMYDSAGLRVNSWAQSNAKLLEQVPELKARYDELSESIREKAQAERDAVGSLSVDTYAKQVELSLTDARTTKEKLAALERAISIGKQELATNTAILASKKSQLSLQERLFVLSQDATMLKVERELELISKRRGQNAQDQLAVARQTQSYLERVVKSEEYATLNAEKRAQLQAKVTAAVQAELDAKERIAALERDVEAQAKQAQRDSIRADMDNIEETAPEGAEKYAKLAALRQKLLELELADLELENQAMLAKVQGNKKLVQQWKATYSKMVDTAIKEFSTQEMRIKKDLEQTSKNELPSAEAKARPEANPAPSAKSRTTWHAGGDPRMTIQEAMGKHNQEVALFKDSSSNSAAEDWEKAVRSSTSASQEHTTALTTNVGSLSSFNERATAGTTELTSFNTTARTLIGAFQALITATSSAAAALQSLGSNSASKGLAKSDKPEVSMPTPSDMGAVTPSNTAESRLNYNNHSSSSVNNYYLDGVRLSQDVDIRQLAQTIARITNQEQRRVRTYLGSWG